MAEVYAERGEYEKSLAVYGRLRRVPLEEPDQIRYLTGLGKAHTENGDFEKAIAVFRELDSYIVDPTLKAAYLLVKARAYTGLDSIPVAIDTYKTIGASYPRSIFSAEAHYRLGEIYQDKLDSLQLAQQEFDKVAGEYAGSPYASESITSSAAISKLLRLNESLKSGGGGEDQASVQFDLAEIELLQFKNYEKALDGYRKVVDEFPDNDLAPRAAYAIAYIYDAELGDTTNAVPAYELVSTRYTYTQQGEFARDALKRLGHPVPEPPPAPPKEEAPAAAASDTTRVVAPGDTTGSGGQTKSASDTTRAVPPPAVTASDTTRAAAPGDTTRTAPPSAAASDTTKTVEQPKAESDTTKTTGRTEAKDDTTNTGGQTKTESDTTDAGEKPKTPEKPGTGMHR